MSIGPWQLLVVLAIILLLFGTKRLRGMGSDLGEAIKGFKKSVSDDEDNKEDAKHLEREESEQTESDSKTEDVSEKR